MTDGKKMKSKKLKYDDEGKEIKKATSTRASSKVEPKATKIMFDDDGQATAKQPAGGVGLEANFPRGGASTEPKHKKFDEDGNEVDELFKSEEIEAKKEHKKNKKQDPKKNATKKKAEKGKATAKQQTPVSKYIFDSYLSQKDIQEGMLLLGTIEGIEELELRISLPYGLKGIVKIVNISDTMTTQLQKISAMEEEGIPVPEEEMISLPELFYIGQVVRCKVLGIVCVSIKKTHVSLSINPKDVNANVTPARLADKMVLAGVVSSKEDHGYEMDLGVRGIKAFLKNKAATSFIDKENNGKDLKEGQYIHCMVQSVSKALKEGESRTVTVMIEPSQVHHALLNESMKIVMDSLVPGMMVKANVDKVTTNSVRVSFLGMKAFVHVRHLKRLLENYNEGDELKLVVLYIHPMTKVLVLSDLPHLKTPAIRTEAQFGSYTEGNLIDEAVVIKVENKTGVYLKLDDNVNALAHKTQLSDKNLNKQPSDLFTKGEKKRCRVMGFLYTDNLVIVSMKESILEQKYLTYDSIIPGEIVKCEVAKVESRGLVVSIGRNIKAFIPRLHLADYTVSDKTLDQRFTEGEELKCRVLTVLPKEHKVTLTNKKTLVRKSCPILCSYAGVQRGDIVQGFVACIRDHGVLVVFCDNVKGWVPKSELSTSRVEFPNKVFYDGQVVKCRVKHVMPEIPRILLSFKLEDEASAPASEAVEHKDIGRIDSAVVTKVSAEGLDLKLKSTIERAFLPVKHLHDDVILCPSLIGAYKAGDIIEKVVIINHLKNLATVSCKQAFINAAEDATLVTSIEKVTPDLLTVGFVKSKAHFGIFVEFTGGLRGLVPLKYISDSHAGDPLELFDEGQTVFVKVQKVEQDKNRITLTMRVSDCYHGNMQTSLDLLDNHLKALAFLQEKCANKKGVKGALAKLKTGEIVQVMVTKVTEDGALCQLDNEVKGFVTCENMKGVNLQQEKEVEMAVLFVDWVQKIVELSCDPWLMNLRRQYLQEKGAKVQEGMIVNSRVVLVKDQFAVAAAKGNVRAVMAYLPNRQIFNDVGRKPKFMLGQDIKLAIKNCDDHHISAILKKADKLTEQPKRSEAKSTKSEAPTKHDFKIGDRVDAVVESVEEDSLKVKLGGTDVIGHAHISQLADKFKQDKNQLLDFKPGRNVPVRVIGLRDSRDMTTIKYLNNNSKMRNTSIPEVTLKTSVIEKPELEPHDHTLHLFSIGQKVNAFYQKFEESYFWFTITPKLLGRMRKADTSDNIKACNEAEKMFKVNTCYAATVLHSQVKNYIDLTLADMKPVENDAVVKGTVISKSAKDGLTLLLSHGVHGTAALTDISDSFTETPLKNFTVDQVCKCYVLESSNAASRRVSLRQSRIENDPSKVRDREILSIFQLKECDTLRGYVQKADVNHILVSIGHDIIGKAAVDLNHTIKQGQVVVVKINKITENEVTLEMPISKVKVPQPIAALTDKADLVKWRVKQAKDFKEKLKLNLSNRKRKVSEQLDTPSKTAKMSEIHSPRIRRTSVQLVDTEDVTSQTNASETVENTDLLAKMTKGQKRKLKRLEKKLGLNTPNEKTVDTDMDSAILSDPDTPSKSPSKKQKKKQNKTKPAAKGEEEDMEVDDEDTPKSVQRSKRNEASCLTTSAGFAWTDDFTLPSVTSEKKADSDDEDDLEEDLNTSDHQKVSKGKQSVTDRKEEEKEIYKRERELLNEDRAPMVTDDFERLVRQSPNSSLVWLRFMAHHLEASEVEKARIIAERALATISFREEQEKLNVWVALLNLENMYGNHETLKDVLDRALQYNDQYKVYNHLIEIYRSAGKMQAAEQVYSTCLKKFGQRLDVWINCGQFYFENQQLDAARKLLKRCFTVLDTKHHADVIGKFAQREFKFGDPNHGVSMFENLLSTYPKRIDLWYVYIDLVMKHNGHEAARRLYERLTDQNLSAKKMKACFKKWLEFEEQHGTPDLVAHVKDKAIHFVEQRAVETPS